PATGGGDTNFPNGAGTSCYSVSGQGGSENLYQFIVPASGSYQFDVTATINTNEIEYFWKKASLGCNNMNWNCIGYTNVTATLASLNFSKGDTIFILANSESNTTSGQTFQLNCV